MSFFGKVFKFQSSENHEDFINSLALPADRTGFFMNFTPDQKIEKTGDTYVYTFNTPRGEKSIPFTSGVAFEDNVRDMAIKNTFSMDGNKLTHLLNFDSGLTITAKKEFSDNKLVEELRNNKWDGVATITYTA